MATVYQAAGHWTVPRHSTAGHVPLGSMGRDPWCASEPSEVTCLCSPRWVAGPPPLRTRGGGPLDSTSLEPTGLSALHLRRSPKPHAQKKALADLFANLQ